jgi:Ca2+/Na+ antiporter
VASLARGRGSLALGNVVGSTIANILGAFSLGLIFYKSPVVDRGPVFEKSSIIYSLALLLVTTLASVLLAFGRHISWRAVGVVSLWSLESMSPQSRT